MNGASSSAPGVDVLWLNDPDADAKEADTLSINEVVQRLRVPARVIRDYQRRGLLAPRAGESFVFDRADCRRIAAIANARRMGFTLTEIKHMFCVDEGRATPRVLQLNREKCMQRIEVLSRRRVEIERMLGRLRQVHILLSERLAGGPPSATS